MDWRSLSLSLSLILFFFFFFFLSLSISLSLSFVLSFTNAQTFFLSLSLFQLFFLSLPFKFSISFIHSSNLSCNLSILSTLMTPSSPVLSLHQVSTKINDIATDSIGGCDPSCSMPKSGLQYVGSNKTIRDDYIDVFHGMTSIFVLTLQSQERTRKGSHRYAFSPSQKRPSTHLYPKYIASITSIRMGELNGHDGLGYRPQDRAEKKAYEGR